MQFSLWKVSRIRLYTWQHWLAIIFYEVSYFCSYCAVRRVDSVPNWEAAICAHDHRHHYTSRLLLEHFKLCAYGLRFNFVWNILTFCKKKNIKSFTAMVSAILPCPYWTFLRICLYKLWYWLRYQSAYADISLPKCTP